MKIIKLILALTIISAHTMNAVWYKPWTWFSNTEDTENTSSTDSMEIDENY